MGTDIAIWISAVAGSLIAVTAVFSLARLIYRARLEEAEWKGRTDESVTSLKTTLRNIEDYLHKLFERGLREVLTDRSPVQLNDLGEAVSEHLGAKDWAQQEAARLQPRFEGQEPFEIYEGVRQYVEDDDRFSSEFQRKMRRTAYEKSVEIIQIRAVLAVELRDALLKGLAEQSPPIGSVTQ